MIIRSSGFAGCERNSPATRCSATPTWRSAVERSRADRREWAGKSTFMKILSGIYEPPPARSSSKAGHRVRFSVGRPARGVSIVPQEFNLAADLSVAENVFLGAELLKFRWLLDRPGCAPGRGAPRGAGRERGPEDRIDGLSAAQKQLVEVCKALAFDASLLILDEPTTMLTRREIDRLFALMRSLKARGMALVYVSHKLAEVKAICDRVIVLKDGELVREAPIARSSRPRWRAPWSAASFGRSFRRRGRQKAG